MKRLISKGEEFFTPKNIAIILTIIYVLSLVPLLMLAGYDYPCADDYTFGSRCRFIWEETHSVWQLLKQAVTAAGWYYINWAGCFSSSFFMVLQPAIYGEQFYAITPYLMLGIMSFGTIYFVHALMTKCLKCNVWYVQSILMVMLLVIVQCNMGAVEAYFWYNGASHYTLMYGFSMFLYGTIIMFLMERKKAKRIIYIVISCILAIIVGGGNYLTSLNAALVFVFLVLGLILFGAFAKNKGILLPVICLYVSFLASVLAPGNSVRAEGSAGLSPIKAVILSFYYMFNYCMSEWTTWFVILCMVIVAVIFWNAAGKMEFEFKYPVVVAAGMFCMTAAAITPCLYGMGNIEAKRIKSIIFTMYILCLTLTICYVTGWLRKQFSYLIVEKTIYTNNSKIVLMTVMALIAAGYVLTATPEPDTFTTSEALVESFSGEAKAYGEVMKVRTQMYRSGEKNLVVPRVPTNPKLLFVSDVKENPDDWENEGVCRFFELESVQLEKEK